VVSRIVFAWILTLPISGGIAYAVYRLLNFCGLH